MKAMCLSGDGQLIERDVSRPEPRQGEVLIRVFAAGVTPTELVWYPTSHTRDGGPRTAAIPAHEFSGQIAEVGEGVTGVSAGQEVYGMNDWFADGALAEYCITRPEWIAPKPRRLSHAEAATVPIGALTAWQGLLDRAKLQPGEQVLIHGGAGAVGVFAVQLARLHNAHVTATASTRNVEFVRELGADRVIDYTKARFEDEARDVDVVFDTVGGDTLQRSWSVLKPNGRLVTIAAGGEATQDARVKQAFFIVEANRSQLIEVGELVDAGKLRSFIDLVAPFSGASDAYTMTRDRKGRGKSVVAVAHGRPEAA